MIAIWRADNGHDEVAPIERISFYTVGITIHLTDGRCLPVRLEAEALMDLRRSYHLNQITRLVITAGS